MENYKEGRKNAICEILTYVHERKILPQEAYDWDTAAIVKECVDNGFLENVKTVTCKDGHALFSKIISIVISLISLFAERLPQITSWIAK